MASSAPANSCGVAYVSNLSTAAPASSNGASARSASVMSVLDVPVSGALAGHEELVRILGRQRDSRSGPRFLRVPPHELCDALARVAPGRTQLLHDVRPAAR